MKISFIIVSWNTCEKTCACIESIRKHMPEHEVIVVDNNSADDSCAQIRKCFPDIRLIENADNRGFGPANNQGVTIAQGDVYCFINSDTEVCDKGIVSLAEGLLMDECVGAMGPRVTHGDGSFQSSYGRFATWASCVAKFGWEFFSPVKTPFYYRDQYNGTEFLVRTEVDWVSGCCFLIQKKMFEQAGGWDERYFAYYEDPALCRTLARLGYKTVYDPSVSIAHYHGSSFSQRDWSFKILNQLRSACIFLFDREDGVRVALFKLLLKIMWAALFALCLPFFFSGRVQAKRDVLFQLLRSCRVVGG